MSKKIIVIGGGVNGLTTATYLAKSGRDVTLVEARPRLGGLAGSDDFGAGYSSLGALADTGQFRRWVSTELGLQNHGLTFASSQPRVTGHQPGQAPLYADGTGVSGECTTADSEDYASFRALIERLRGPILKIFDRPPLDPQGSVLPLLGPLLSVRALGRRDMTALMRIPPMCGGDWMRDSFRNERLGSLIAHGGLMGQFGGPWSPWTAANILFDRVAANGPVQGGSPALVRALEGAARAYGVTIRLDSEIARIELNHNRVSGVTLASGERLDANMIGAAVDPKSLFLTLVGPRNLSTQFAREMSNYRVRGTTAVIDLGLTSLPLDRAGEAATWLRTGHSYDGLEQAFDPLKYGEIPDTPVVELRSQEAEGRISAAVLVRCAPHSPRGGWTDELRQRLMDNSLRVLGDACPNLVSSIETARLRTPFDLESEFRLSGGHLFHGEHAPDQLLFMRPSSSTAKYVTPIQGLYLCGGGAHPGGGLTGVPGALAAKTMMA